MMDKVKYLNKCPDGIKAYYSIAYNDLMGQEFLHETSLLDPDNITTNFTKRVEKIKEIAIQLNTKPDFTSPYLIFKVEPYNLEKTLKKYLPHLIV